MVLTIGKGVKQYLGAHREWLSSDFDCHCKYPECTTTLVDTDLVDGLDALSDVLGKPRLNDGFRCAKHNSEVGGVPDSQHLLGKAADVSSPDSMPNTVAAAAERIPVFDNGGIGLYSSFVHLDVRGHRARWGKEIQC